MRKWPADGASVDKIINDEWNGTVKQEAAFVANADVNAAQFIIQEAFQSTTHLLKMIWQLHNDAMMPRMMRREDTMKMIWWHKDGNDNGSNNNNNDNDDNHMMTRQWCDDAKDDKTTWWRWYDDAKTRMTMTTITATTIRTTTTLIWWLDNDAMMPRMSRRCNEDDTMTQRQEWQWQQ
jgi:hypothetical protein